jgi:Zinc knuckle
MQQRGGRGGYGGSGAGRGRGGGQSRGEFLMSKRWTVWDCEIPDPVQCHNCGRTGHISRDCNQQRQPQPTQHPAGRGGGFQPRGGSRGGESGQMARPPAGMSMSLMSLS